MSRRKRFSIIKLPLPKKTYYNTKTFGRRRSDKSSLVASVRIGRFKFLHYFSNRRSVFPCLLTFILLFLKQV